MYKIYNKSYYNAVSTLWHMLKKDDTQITSLALYILKIIVYNITTYIHATLL